MTYFSNEDLATWVVDKQKQNFYGTLVSLAFGSFAGLGIYLQSNAKVDKRFIVGIIGLLFIIILFLYAYFRKSGIYNNTIKEIEISDLNIVIKTFPCKLFLFYNLEAKTITINLSDIIFLKSEYPLKEKRSEEIECFKFKVGDDEYYLLDTYFEKELIGAVNEKLNSKKLS